MISGNMVGSYSQIGKTMIIIDSEGNELTGVVTEKLQVFDATDNDVREGKVYASDSGVSTGTKNIPAYHTFEGAKIVTRGSSFSVYLGEYYDYTKFQAIICPFNTNLSNSVAAEKVVILDNVYNVQSTISLGKITLNSNTQSVDFEFTNTSNISYLIRYFTYKEVY